VESGGKTSEGPSVKGHVRKLRRWSDLMSRDMCELVDSGGFYCPGTSLMEGPTVIGMSGAVDGLRTYFSDGMFEEARGGGTHCQEPCVEG
jgi:hypothetical protein